MIEIVQGTPEWKAARLGKLTSSRIADALASTKSGWGASRANLIAELVAERLTGNLPEGFTSEAMKWGTATEPMARSAYEFSADVEVTEIGFINHPVIAMAGCSPDGLVGDDGLVEIKCPGTATHIEALLGAPIPGKYQHQMQWQMACTGRAWCDFVSFDPRMPGDMQIVIKRLMRLDAERMADFEKQAREFLAEVDAKVEALTRRFRQVSEAA